MTLQEAVKHLRTIEAVLGYAHDVNHVPQAALDHILYAKKQLRLVRDLLEIEGDTTHAD